MRIFFVITIIGIAQLSCMTRHRAVRLAEEFVRDNGYTNSLFDTSKRKLTYELYDQMYQLNDGKYYFDSIIKRRHNSLESKASFIAYDAKFKEYHIGFNYKNDTGKGRSVTVGSGHYVKIDHQAPLFSTFEQLK
jgi:hypothetical protein